VYFFLSLYLGLLAVYQVVSLGTVLLGHDHFRHSTIAKLNSVSKALEEWSRSLTAAVMDPDGNAVLQIIYNLLLVGVAFAATGVSTLRAGVVPMGMVGPHVNEQFYEWTSATWAGLVVRFLYCIPALAIRIGDGLSAALTAIVMRLLPPILFATAPGGEPDEVSKIIVPILSHFVAYAVLAVLMFSANWAVAWLRCRPARRLRTHRHHHRHRHHRRRDEATEQSSDDDDSSSSESSASSGEGAAAAAALARERARDVRREKRRSVPAVAAAPKPAADADKKER